MSMRIEKTIDLKAPIERVWTALTDYQQFGAWFGVALEAPIVVGAPMRGKVTYPGMEHLTWEAKVVEMQPPSRFAFTWHPFAVDPAVDYSSESPTRVQFQLEPVGDGVRLTVVESGFEALPAHRLPEALLRNERGWETQMTNIAAYVGG